MKAKVPDRHTDGARARILRPTEKNSTRSQAPGQCREASHGKREALPELRAKARLARVLPETCSGRSTARRLASSRSVPPEHTGPVRPAAWLTPAFRAHRRTRVARPCQRTWQGTFRSPGERSCCARRVTGPPTEDRIGGRRRNPSVAQRHGSRTGRPGTLGDRSGANRVTDKPWLS